MPTLQTQQAGRRAKFCDDLIYDVGLHNGDDTVYYLARGYRVVAIDADPDLARAGQVNFAREIDEGRLTILNVGISKSVSVSQFWICPSNTAWNSFDRNLAGRNGLDHYPVEIQTRPFADILEEYGIPAYLKIDIEGHDRMCLEALREFPAKPTFVSSEDGATDSMGTIRTLVTLRDVGYRYFNLVSQVDFRPLFARGHRSYRPNALIRGVRSAAQGRFKLPLLCKLVEPFTYKHQLSKRNGGHEFKYGSSGPWGTGIPGLRTGAWVEFDEAQRWYTRIRNQFLASGNSAMSFWCDWHATLERP
jgi:FkbM family methyltransferase